MPDFRLPILIALLGSPDWTTREHAQRAMRAMPPRETILYLMACENGPSAEVAMRSRAVVAAFYRRNAASMAAAIMPTGYPRVPWICPSVCDYEIYAHYLDKARERFDFDQQNEPEYLPWRCATLLYVEEMVRTREPRQKIVDMLDNLAASERRYIQQSGKHFRPPLVAPTAPLLNFPPPRKRHN